MIKPKVSTLQIRCFVVRDKVTGKYLPPLQSNRGATNNELGPNPRIFYMKQHAVQSMKWWLEGGAYMDFHTDWETGQRESVGILSVPIAERQDKGVVNLEVIEATVAFNV